MTRFKDIPRRMLLRPTDHRGFPVPYFVGKVDGEWDFRIVAAGRVAECWNHAKCWLCGQPLGRYCAFVVGPMCTVNRTSSEPMSHVDCAEFAAKACPFLTKPKMVRNEKDVPEGTVDPAGVMLKRNPGVTAIWVADRNAHPKLGGPHSFGTPGGGVLFNIGEPVRVDWWREGRKATAAEVIDAMESGMPALEAMCERDAKPGEAYAELARRYAAALVLVPGVAE